MTLLQRFRAWAIRRDEERYAALREYREYQIEVAARVVVAVASGISAAFAAWNVQKEKP